MRRLQALAGHAIDTIRINSFQQEFRKGRLFWVKKRNPTAVAVIAAANAFFRLCGNPVQIFNQITRWRNWEIECFQLLHGSTFSIFPEDSRSLYMEAVPGKSLSHHLNAGTLTTEMLTAAGCEFRRCHELTSPTLGKAWSHSDPHSGNILFDPSENRARLIDFETSHLPSLSTSERHADDLLVLLQDLMGRLPKEHWPNVATSFLQAYDSPEILSLLKKRLYLPRPGPARVWWAIRTTYMSSSELTHRLQTLRALLP